MKKLTALIYWHVWQATLLIVVAQPDDILQITAIQLVNSITDTPIINVTNNLAVSNALLTKSVAVQALTSDDVESVLFTLTVNADSETYIESYTPYVICARGQHDISSCPGLDVGTYTITTTAYSENSAGGKSGQPRKVTFTVVDRPVKAPVVTPKQAPRSSPILQPFRPPVSVPVKGAPTFVSSCKIPQFLDSVWESVQPAYPISVAEPHGQLVRNDLVIFSGFVRGLVGVVNRTYAKDVRTLTSPWRRMEDVPIPIGITHTPTAVVDNRVFMCGGYLGGVPGPHIADCFVYDNIKAPGSDQWARIARLPNGGSAGAGMIFDSASRTLFYAGGSRRPIPGNRFSVDVDEVWKYNLDEKDLGWVASARIPFKANHMSSVTHKDATTGLERHYFMGGQIGENEHTGNVPHMFEFLAANETWVRRASMPMGRGHAMASTRSLGCGFVIVSGSVNTNTLVKNRTNDISYYDIPTNKWTSIGTVPYGIVTPVVDIDRFGYMHFIDTRGRSYRRRISY